MKEREKGEKESEIKMKGQAKHNEIDKQADIYIDRERGGGRGREQGILKGEVSLYC